MLSGSRVNVKGFTPRASTVIKLSGISICLIIFILGQCSETYDSLFSLGLFIKGRKHSLGFFSPESPGLDSFKDVLKGSVLTDFYIDLLKVYLSNVRKDQ